MLDLEPRHLDLVRGILRRRLPLARAWAFGSRVKGTAQRFSDLDLAVDADAPIDLLTLALLDADFCESDLPMKVDVIDMHGISDAFKRIVVAQRIELA